MNLGSPRLNSNKEPKHSPAALESSLLVKFELVGWRSVDYKVLFLESIVKLLKLLESVDAIWCEGILVSDLCGYTLLQDVSSKMTDFRHDISSVHIVDQTSEFT